MLMVLLLVGVTVGMTLSACGGEQHLPIPTQPLPTAQVTIISPTQIQITLTVNSPPPPTQTPSFQDCTPCTAWENLHGRQIAANAHALLSNASEYYFWGTGEIENNSNPPLAGLNINMPIPTISPDSRYGWDNIPDVYNYKNGRTPFVCGDVVDWAYNMAGINLQTQLPGVSAEYPNRWARSSYG